jgi:hypothetical protein
LAEKYKNGQKIPTSSIAKPSTIYPNWDFWFENMPSGNTGMNQGTISIAMPSFQTFIQK